MAITVTQKPNEKVIPAYHDIVFVLDNGATSQYYHKYVLTVKKGATTVATLKVSANNQDVGIVNISQIVQDYCKSDVDGYDLAGTTTYNSTKAGVGAHTTQHAIHQIDQYSRNKSNLVKFTIEAHEEYATTATGNVAQQGSTVSVGDYIVWNGTAQHDNGLVYDYTPYILDGNTKQFLTSVPASVKRKVRSGDYHTVAMLNGTFTNQDTTTEYSNPDYLRIYFYDSSDTQLSTVVVNNDDVNGGYTPSSATDQSVRGFLYAGVGLKNFTNAGYTVPATTAYYTVQAQYGLSVEQGAVYTFELQEDDCKGFDTIRLAYLNRLGAWDYFNFTKKSTRTTNIQKSLFKSAYGTWQDDSYSYGTWEGGSGANSVTAVETIEANSDFMSEAEAAAMEELFTSPQVFMQDGDNFVPVFVTEQSYTKRTKANDKLMQYIVAIEKSHSKRIQRV